MQSTNKKPGVKKTRTTPISIPKYILDINQRHAVINVSGKCLILNETIDPISGGADFSLSSLSDFKNFNTNKKIKVGKKMVSIATEWLDSENRREYAGLIFDPGKTAPGGYYNLWKGLAVEPKLGDWSLFRDHIINVICDGKKSRGEWVIAWLARILQDPGGQRPGTAIVLRGRQGTGKGVFVNTFGQLLGKHFLQISQAGQITGRFNNHLKDTLLAFVDEGFWAADRQAEGVLKSMITEPSVVIESKGKDIIRVKNHLNLVVASNSEWVVPAGMEERRFFVLDVSDKRMQDNKYFKAVATQMKTGGLEAMLHDMLALDISGVDLKHFEQTRGLFEQKLHSMTTLQKYWYERLVDGQILLTDDGVYNTSGWEKKIPTHVQHADYIQFVEKMKDRYPLSDSQFAIQLSKLCPGIKRARPRDGNGKRIRVRIFPELDECRKAFNTLLKTQINWT